MRHIIVGDVHGCVEEFAELLRMVDYRKGQDDLISAGDLLDRGPDPVGTVAFAMEQGARLVQGNHEEKALRWLRHELRVKMDPLYKNPMRQPPGKRADEWRALADHQVAYLRAAPFVIEVPEHNLLVVHAGFEPGVPMNKQKNDRLTRVRFVDANGEMVGYTEDSLEQPEGTCFWTDLWKGPQNVVYGHAVHSASTPHITLDDASNVWTMGIDTGCVFGGQLTAAVFEESRKYPHFVQVKAKRVYYDWPRDLGTLPP